MNINIILVKSIIVMRINIPNTVLGRNLALVTKSKSGPNNASNAATQILIFSQLNNTWVNSRVISVFRDHPREKRNEKKKTKKTSMVTFNKKIYNYVTGQNYIQVKIFLTQVDSCTFWSSSPNKLFIN